jgi:hypothetical protein
MTNVPNDNHETVARAYIEDFPASAEFDSQRRVFLQALDQIAPHVVDELLGHVSLNARSTAHRISPSSANRHVRFHRQCKEHAVMLHAQGPPLAILARHSHFFEE